MPPESTNASASSAPESGHGDIRLELATRGEALICFWAAGALTSSPNLSLESFGTREYDRDATKKLAATAELFERCREQLGARVQLVEALGMLIALVTPGEFEQIVSDETVADIGLSGSTVKKFREEFLP